MIATLIFITEVGKRWVVEKSFSSEQHMNNFIAYVERNKCYTLDEVYC